MSNQVDYTAIASALASRFTAAHITAPTGEHAIRASTYLIPEGINAPCVVVFPPTESAIHYHPGMMVTSDQIWTVNFYLNNPADYARVADKILKWWTVIYAALDGNLQLGLDYVNYAVVTGMARGELPYGSARGTPDSPGYPGIVLTVLVQTRDSRTFVA